MRVFAVVVVLLSLVASVSVAEARGKRSQRPQRHTTHAKHAAKKRVAITKDAAAAESKKTTKRDRSIGAPWSGRLQASVKLSPGDGYHLRRPWRTYATRTTVNFVKTAIRDTFDAYPKAHVLAIGDLSQEGGGWISEHHSHQSGRDVDLGLFYKKKPRGYPASFVNASASTLDAAATWKLVSTLARTADDDGGVQWIFLDQRLHAVLYRWADTHDISQKRIAQVQRVLRHEPNHANHLHVRFKCRARDTACR